jgi:hypothetical protein
MKKSAPAAAKSSPVKPQAKGTVPKSAPVKKPASKKG